MKKFDNISIGTAADDDTRLDDTRKRTRGRLTQQDDMNKVQSHFLVNPNRLDKVTRRVIAPYAQIERKIKKEAEKEEKYLNLERFTVFLEDTVDLDSLLYETAMVLKTVTNSSGVFVYIVNEVTNELVLMPHFTKNPTRHEVNIPIVEGQVAAAHAAFTKEYLLLDDVPRDRRFAEGLKWIDAKCALCMPIVKPDGNCYAVLELYRMFDQPYDNDVEYYLPPVGGKKRLLCTHKTQRSSSNLRRCAQYPNLLEHFQQFDRTVVYTVLSVSFWAGAAVHQANARVTLQRSEHLTSELVELLQRYFCDLATFDTMITDMLAIVKSVLGAMRSSFYIIDREHVGHHILADMWDDGWANEKVTMPKKKTRINLSLEQSPAAFVAQKRLPLNVVNAFKDHRFAKEVDPVTGTLVRHTLVWPITDKNGLIGLVQVTNKTNTLPFLEADEDIFRVFVNYCALIVHFNSMQQLKIYHDNVNKVYAELMQLHLKPCKHDFDELMDTNGVLEPPANFNSYDYHISQGNKEEIPGLVCYIFIEVFGNSPFERPKLADFVFTVLRCYRPNAYHNAEHAFCFVHTMYMILTTNSGTFDFVEMMGLLIGGLCHDIDHPGYNNNFLALTKHPLSQMYKSSTLENHHWFLAKKIIEDKKVLIKIPEEDRERIMEQVKYNILCTDLALYFQIRAQLAAVISERAFEWTNAGHRNMLKGILMTTSDLSGNCKPFIVSKKIASAVYQEFYDQGDRERALGYSPLSMMDRRRAGSQPTEQIQFLTVVVLPCLLLLQTLLPNTAPLIDNCRKTQEGWHEEIEQRGQKLWRQDDSVRNVKINNST